MQGLWKENLGGWNSKDNRRKKQTRNNTLRDKGRAIYNKFNGWKAKNEAKSEVFRIEGAMEIVYRGKKYCDNTIHYEADIYRALVTYPIKDDNGDLIVSYKIGYTTYYEKTYRYVYVYKDGNDQYRYTNATAYNFKNEDTDKNLKDFFNLDNIQAHKLEISNLRKTKRKVKLNIEKRLKEIKEVHTEDFYPAGEDFIYNKPLPSWKVNTFYNDGKRRKIGQKIANSIDRAKAKAYINNKDWDAEIKTGAYSKSIAWLVH